MPDFWLDSDSMMTPHRNGYSFDIAPGFWKWLEQMADAGKIASPMRVHGELMDGDDQLKEWAANLKSDGRLFVPAGEGVQHKAGEISDWVMANCEEPKAKVFLSKADQWVIASAAELGGRVVTFEKREPNSPKVKVPEVCDAFGVQCLNTYQLLKELGARFDFKGAV